MLLKPNIKLKRITDIGYDGYACIEVEDKAFEGSKQRVMDSVALSCRYMRQFVI